MDALYFTGKPMSTPYTSGLFAKDFTLEEMRRMSAEVTEEEKADPFYDYYTEILADLEDVHIKTLKNGPMPSECGFLPGETGKVLLDQAEGYPENGYCVLENGVGFASVTVEFDGVTDEMFAKYRDEFAHTENRLLQYKLWYPHMHMIHFEDAIIENWGWGFCFQEMDPKAMSFETLGIDPEQIPIKIPNCIGFVGLGGNCIGLDDPTETKYSMIMAQFTTETEQGRKLRILYWNGMGCDKTGTMMVNARPDRAETEKMMGMMYRHGAQEYRNQIRLMKQFWDNEAR